MSNLIFSAFAYKEEYNPTPNINEKEIKSAVNIYIKNIFVALKSAKIQNPNDDVALVTNKEIPENFRKLFARNNIYIYHCDFNEFTMPKDFTWSLAFYKLCALKYIVSEGEYNNYLLLDGDTVTIRSYNDLWQEAFHGLVLFNINHNFSHRVRKDIVEVYEELYGYSMNIQQYGGELICGNKDILQNFVEKCEEVYSKVKIRNFNINKDSEDELITSIAATKMSNIFDGGAYIDRYWTGRFYLVSTNYVNDPVAIWHLPGEKKQGLLTLYNYLIKNDTLPKNVHKIFGLPKSRRPDFILYNLKRIARKLF
ncbi:hypothetical protein ACFYKT_17410 [Cytobacillus sp. FJAT-53684]|uniref:Glycosyl transferase n=1 Tax=Cytobacillus mangrovibacter TaxID=3299024 RepID=A0ABW6K303_9BACI